MWISGRDFGFAGDQTQWSFLAGGGGRRGGLAYPALRGVNQLLNAAVMAACEAMPRHPAGADAGDPSGIHAGGSTGAFPGAARASYGGPSMSPTIPRLPACWPRTWPAWASSPKPGR